MASCGRWRAHNPLELFCNVGMDEEAFQAFALLGHDNRSLARSGLTVPAVVGSVLVVSVKLVFCVATELCGAYFTYACTCIQFVVSQN